MKRMRRRVPYLDELTWADMTHLVERGRMTWAEVNRATYEGMVERCGGDPYAHLRDLSRGDLVGSDGMHAYSLPPWRPTDD